MSADARISTGLPNHPKTKKLIRRLGLGAAWHLVCMFLWVAANRTKGDLTGLTDEDIELAIDWAGEPGAFVRECVNVGFVEGDERARAIHDWAEHNPWAASADIRSAKGKWNAIKRYHGQAEADRQVPEYAAIRAGANVGEDCTEEASSNAGSMPQQGSSTAPSPSPIPIPLPKPVKARGRATVRQGDPEGFADFWAMYPRKDARKDAVKAWGQLRLDQPGNHRAEVLSGLRAWLTSEKWLKDDGRYIHLPATWLRDERWRDESIGKPTTSMRAAAPAWEGAR